MPKSPSKNLFKLIKSLTVPEKIYIKNRVRKDEQGSANYYKMLDLIDSQQAYNEEQVARGLGVKISNTFAKQKGYLYGIILKRLEEFNAEESKETEATHLLLQVKILQDKSLFDQAEKLLEKVKSLAENYDLVFLNQSLLMRKLFLIRAKKEYEKIRSGEFEKEIARTVGLAENYLMYNLYGTQLEYLAQQFIVARTAQQHNSITQLLKLPHFSDKKLASNNRSMGLYFLTKSKLLSMIGRHEEACELINSYVDFLKKNRSYNENFFQNYFIAIHNKISFELMLKKYSSAKKSLSDFEKYLQLARTELEEPLLIKAILNYFMSKSSFNFLKGDFDSSLNLIENIKIDISLEKIGPLYFTLIRFHFAVIYLCLGNFKKSGKYISEVLKAIGNNENFQSYVSVLKVMQLIVYYEMNEQDVMAYSIRSTYHFLLKRNKLFKTENAILKFIRVKLPKANSRKELIAYFKELRLDLEIIIGDPYEKTFLDYFDLTAWLESKIQNRSMSDILKERFKKACSM